MKDRYDFVTDIARRAGEKILELKAKPMDISSKDNDPRNILTNVDIEIGHFVTEAIQAGFPGEVVYSEEADADVTSGSFWAVDPIDGTASFARDLPHYAVVIAYVEKGQALVGAVYNPVTRELFSFEKGKGAYLNGKAIRTSAVTEPIKSMVFLTAGRNAANWDRTGRLYRYLLGNVNKTRVWSSSALDFCFVAAGRIEGCIYINLTAVDIIAAIGLLREAGGLVEGESGPIDERSKESQLVIATNNQETLNMIRQGLQATANSL